VGAAGRTVLPTAMSTLDSAAARGLPLAKLRDRMAARFEDLIRYTEAYRAFIRPRTGSTG